MKIVEITQDYSVAPQIAPEDVAEIAALGYRSILCNRPDGEAPDQPDFAAIAAEAEKHGLRAAHVPVVSGAIVPQDVRDFRATIDDLPGPVLAYCRSGARCQYLWQASR